MAHYFLPDEPLTYRDVESLVAEIVKENYDDLAGVGYVEDVEGKAEDALSDIAELLKRVEALEREVARARAFTAVIG